jgi:hypothetical protein
VLRDWSGYQNHGTLTNGPTWQASDGKYSLFFNSLANTSVQLNATVAKPASSGSIAFHFKPTSSSPSYKALVMQGENSGIYYYSGTGIDVYPFGLGGAALFSVGVWHHLAVTWDNATARLFIDGKQSSTSASNPLFPVSNFCSEANEAGDGNLDDIRIYNRALSAQEIRLLASRRGIAYEMAPRRRSGVSVGFSAAWARRRALVIGGGMQ